MRIKTHILIAVLSAIAIVFYLRFERVYLLGLIIGAMLPDVIEPPYSRYHRHFWHSKRLLGGLPFILVFVFVISMIDETFYWLFFTLIGYELHLLGDLLFYGLPR